MRIECAVKATRVAFPIVAIITLVSACTLTPTRDFRADTGELSPAPPTNDPTRRAAFKTIDLPKQEAVGSGKVAAASDTEVGSGATDPLNKAALDDHLPQIVVTSSIKLDGVWEFQKPGTVSVGWSGNGEYGPMRPFICRLVEDAKRVSGSCLPSDLHLDGELVNGQVSFSWQSNVVSYEFRGKLLSQDKIDGQVRLGMFGLGMSAPLPMHGTKILSDGHGQQLPPTPGRSSVNEIDTHNSSLEKDEVLTNIANIALSSFPKTLLDELGPLELVKLAGKISDLKKPDRTVNVYDLEFSHGSRICTPTFDDAGTMKNCHCL